MRRPRGTLQGVDGLDDSPRDLGPHRFAPMRPIDVMALAGVLLALPFFISSSTSFRLDRMAMGIVKLLLALVLMLAGVAAGVASVGTEGYQALRPEPTTLGRVTVERLGRDSIVARVTSPEGLTRTFRIPGNRLRLDVRVLHWKAGATLMGASDTWEIEAIEGETGESEPAPGGRRALTVSRPVSVYELALRYPVLAEVVASELWSVRVAPDGAPRELTVSTTGLTASSGS